MKSAEEIKERIVDDEGLLRELLSMPNPSGDVMRLIYGYGRELSLLRWVLRDEGVSNEV